MPGKVKNLSEIANEYGVHPHTMRNWLKPIWKSLRTQGRRSFLPWQIKLIYDFLDAPESLNDNK